MSPISNKAGDGIGAGASSLGYLRRSISVLPPHEPDDEHLVSRLVASLESGEALVAVAVIRHARGLQAITGSHRLAAWARFEAATGEDRRRLVELTDEEVVAGLEQLRLPPDIDQAWPLLDRIGSLARALHWTAIRPEVKEALAGQW